MKTIIKSIALISLLIACSCAKDELVTGYILSQSPVSVEYPTSETPITLDVTITMNYIGGEYVFTADRVFPCDIKFKAYSKYGGVSFFGMKKGTIQVSHPFLCSDTNAPRDFYLIGGLVHWKCNNEEKNEYVDGNVTYHFLYSLPGISASDGDE